jgi:tetratricopeptide (TPR) repeat protein
MIREKVLAPDHPDVANSLSNLAANYSDQGRYSDAEPLLSRSLAIYEKVLGPAHPDLAPVLSNLAFLYDRQGRFADAEPIYKREGLPRKTGNFGRLYLIMECVSALMVFGLKYTVDAHLITRV